jgi:hypothetical protein
MIIIQPDIETRDINLVIGEYGISLNPELVYTVEPYQSPAQVLSVDELNEYPWDKHFNINDLDTMYHVIFDLAVHGYLDDIATIQQGENCRAQEKAEGLEFPDSKPKELKYYQNIFKCGSNIIARDNEENNNPLLNALKRKDAPTKEQLYPKKSNAKQYLTRVKYGKFQRRVANRLVDELHQLHGDKLFWMEVREIAYYIYNNGSFDHFEESKNKR